MSYAIYKTEAIILRLIPVGEANMDIVMFTQLFGKITVRAQSVRKQESTMRMFLTRFRVVTIDLVRGKSVWRLTGISSTVTQTLFREEVLLQSSYRMFRLAEFLVQGELPHPELFEFFKKVVTLPPAETPQSAKGFEIFCIITILEYLGYWSGSRLRGELSQEHYAACYRERAELVKKINESISATQIMVY